MEVNILKITITNIECTSYPKTYKTLITKISEAIGVEPDFGITISDFLLKYKEQLQPLQIEIIGSEEVRNNLGYKDTVRFYREILKISSFDELSSNIVNLKNAENCKGQTMFEKMISVFEEHNVEIIFN